jgi:hypothetical protein
MEPKRLWSSNGRKRFLTPLPGLAPSLGTVRLLNGTPGTWDLFALPGATGPRIRSVSHKDTRHPKDAAYNWTWTPARPMPPGGVGATNEIA